MWGTGSGTAMGSTWTQDATLVGRISSLMMAAEEGLQPTRSSAPTGTPGLAIRRSQRWNFRTPAKSIPCEDGHVKRAQSQSLRYGMTAAHTVPSSRRPHLLTMLMGARSSDKR